MVRNDSMHNNGGRKTARYASEQPVQQALRRQRITMTLRTAFKLKGWIGDAKKGSCRVLVAIPYSAVQTVKIVAGW